MRRIDEFPDSLSLFVDPVFSLFSGATDRTDSGAIADLVPGSGQFWLLVLGIVLFMTGTGIAVMDIATPDNPLSTGEANVTTTETPGEPGESTITSAPTTDEQGEPTPETQTQSRTTETAEGTSTDDGPSIGTETTSTTSDEFDTTTESTTSDGFDTTTETTEEPTTTTTTTDTTETTATTTDTTETTTTTPTTETTTSTSTTETSTNTSTTETTTNTSTTETSTNTSTTETTTDGFLLLNAGSTQTGGIGTFGFGPGMVLFQIVGGGLLLLRREGST